MSNILLGRYELLKGFGDNHVSVGFGSYGQVKLAHDHQDNVDVAVKIVISSRIRYIKLLKIK